MAKKILIIEDEAALQKTLAAALKSAGYGVLQALDGEIGLRLARSEKPDLILLDLIMPIKNGFEVLAELKADPEMKDFPVIVLTNLESIEDVDKALTVGVDTYLVKANYTLDEILAKVRQTLKEEQ
ncbi:MAG: response regulator [Candidatus Pacebacteria bacterium]|nr:response regulator [Candidatus Paceibacterota bacterium]